MPDQASTVSSDVDLLYALLIGMTAFFAGLIFLMVAIFAIRYRRRSSDEIPRPNLGSLRLELIWTVLPLLIADRHLHLERQHLLQDPAGSGRRDAGLRSREAMDVEVPASGGESGNQ